MPEQTITTAAYKLFPSPRNVHRTLFEHEVFVPHAYTIIDLAAMHLKGKTSLFAAHRLADNKPGQLVSFELLADVARFNAQFVAD